MATVETAPAPGMLELSDPIRPSTGVSPAPTSPSATEVYAIHGADPEVLAYAMAKYSRSALTMKESLAEISASRAEQFLNTFYFQYGHRSIADLAHIPFAIERLSLLAAIDLVDEQRWDGQERSTRYQNFQKSGWFTPDFGPDTPTFTAAIESLFAAYDRISSGMFEALVAAIPRPDEMKPEAYGQIVNARTLETQVSRLLSSPFAEIRSLGEQLRAAAAGPAWNVQQTTSAALIADLNASPDPHARAAASLLDRPVATAPTLVKYAQPSDYQVQTRVSLAQAAADLMAGAPIASAPVVDLIDDGESLEVELATSLLYPNCHYPYRQLRDQVAALPEARRTELIHLGTRHRGRHDELLRGFSAGAALRFDILMDVGGFRDMHRHRRCTQLLQPYTDLHGYEDPSCPGQPTLAEAGLEKIYVDAMARALVAYRSLQQSTAPEAAQSAQYLLPLGMRCRSLFKMDFAEALYISELRSGPAGHFSYRRVAWKMYQAVARRHPSLASLFRIEDVHQPIDLLRR